MERKEKHLKLVENQTSDDRLGDHQDGEGESQGMDQACPQSDPLNSW